MGFAKISIKKWRTQIIWDHSIQISTIWLQILSQFRAILWEVGSIKKSVGLFYYMENV